MLIPLMLLAACPFEVVRDDTQRPTNTLLVAHGAVVLGAATSMKVECDAERVRLIEEGAIAPISFRLRQPLQLVLEVPQPEAPKGAPDVRQAAWARWATWAERVRSLRRNASVVSFGEAPDGGASAIDTFRAYLWEQSRQAIAEAALLQTQRHEQLKPYKFGIPARLGTMTSSSAEFVFWSRKQLCVVQGERADGPTVRCYDPKTSKWSAKAPRERWPKESVALNGMYPGDCTLQRGGQSWTFDELGFQLDDIPDEDVQASNSERQQFETDCAGCPGMMCTREQECREREGDGSMVSFTCPEFLAPSPDGSSIAFSVQVSRNSPNCWANGYRCAEDSHEVLRTLLVLIPIQR